MFRDRSDLLADDDDVRGYGVAVTPGPDGPFVFVAGYGEPNRLYTREDGRFVDTACGIVADGDRHGMGVCAADVDGDGCEELYVHNCASYAGLTGDSDLLLDRLESDRYRWTDVFALEVNADRLNFRAGRSVAALDRLGTGRYGFAIAGYGAPVAFYELGRDGEASDLAPAIGLDVAGGCRSLLPGPIVSDRTDLFVSLENASNRLFRNENGQYVPVELDPALADPDGDARGVALVDDGTGFAIVLGNWEGESRLCRRDGAGEFVDVAPESLASARSVRSVIAADFDNDGREELFCNQLGEPNHLLERVDPLDPDAGVTDTFDTSDRWVSVDVGDAAEPDGFGTGAIAADLNGDGALELLVVHGEVAAQPISVYAVSDASERDWVRVRPTTAAGAPARGAVVRLETTRGVQRRVIDAGAGYLCQTEPVAHFGLGDADPVRATVRWCDGRKRVIDPIRPRSELQVLHPAATEEPSDHLAIERHG